MKEIDRTMTESSPKDNYNFDTFYSQFDQTHGKESRRTWYNQSTQAYAEARPRYPEHQINVTLSVLGKRPLSLIEVGCGPGTLTEPLVQRGHTILAALDPAPENCRMAEYLCRKVAKDKENEAVIVESTFEDWEIPDNLPSVDAIVCGNSFHWISTPISYTKTAQILSRNRNNQGYLLLFWVVPPTPTDLDLLENDLQPIYDAYGLSNLGRDQSKPQEYYMERLGMVAQGILDSGLYEKVVDEDQILWKFHEQSCEYSVDRYLQLQSTLSGYIALDETLRTKLFSDLKEKINSRLQDRGKRNLAMRNYWMSQVFKVKKEQPAADSRQA